MKWKVAELDFATFRKFAEGYVKDVNEFLVEGQEVTVKIIGDKDGKISLSIRKAQPKKEGPKKFC